MSDISISEQLRPSPVRGFVQGALGALLLAGLAAFLLVLYRTAWLSDDAYITFRSVDNFLNGYGLRWNVAERVQAYTHPLWMFLVIPVYAITRDMFLSGIVVCFAVSFAAVATLVFAVARHRGLGLAVLVLALFSRAFMEFSTSGLENPLTHLLLALFAWRWLDGPETPRNTFFLSLCAGLAVVNRMDTLLLFAPALAWLFFARFGWRTTLMLALGLMPVPLWLAFSVFYYGFPFPNTAYAKLGTGIESSQLALQGIYYVINSLAEDPITLATVLLAVIVATLQRNLKSLLLLAGTFLYILYVVKIGGDFMSGRFFAAPFFVALIALVQWAPGRARVPVQVVGMVLVLLLGLRNPMAPPYSGAAFSAGAGYLDPHAIANERKYYFSTSSLLGYMAGQNMPIHKYAEEGRAYRAKGEAKTVAHGAIGFRGFFAGPEIHIIDYYALADPLLARLPAQYDPHWRIGHFARATPPGYMETAGSGTNKIQDPQLREYYDQLRLITAGPLLSPARWRAIWTMNTGGFDHLIDRDAYRFYGMLRVPPAEVSQVRTAGTAYTAPGVKTFNHRGIAVTLPEPAHAPAVELSIRADLPHELLFMRDKEIVGRIEAGPSTQVKDALAVFTVPVPQAAMDAGYDEVRVFPVPAKRGERTRNQLGHLRLVEDE